MFVDSRGDLWISDPILAIGLFVAIFMTIVVAHLMLTHDGLVDLHADRERPHRVPRRRRFTLPTSRMARGSTMVRPLATRGSRAA